jgi:hypothetical protein
MKYLKKFENNTDYKTYIDGSDTVTPNVSLVGHDEIHYNPYVNRLIQQAKRLLADNGYTKPFNKEGNVWNVIVTLSSEEPVNECLTLAVAGRNTDNHAGCVIFGNQEDDAFAAISIEYEYKSEGDTLAEITSVDWDFFQGSSPGDLSSDLDIIGYVEENFNSETLVGEKALVL